MNGLKELRRQRNKSIRGPSLPQTAYHLSLLLVREPSLVRPPSLRVQALLRKLLLDLMGKDPHSQTNINYIGCLQSQGVFFNWTPQEQLYLSRRLLKMLCQLANLEVCQETWFPLFQTLGQLQVQLVDPKVFKEFMEQAGQVKDTLTVSYLFAVLGFVITTNKSTPNSASKARFLSLATRTQLLYYMRQQARPFQRIMARRIEFLRSCVLVFQSEGATDMLRLLDIQRTIVLLKAMNLPVQLTYTRQLIKFVHSSNSFSAFFTLNTLAQQRTPRDLLLVMLSPQQQEYLQEQLSLLFEMHCHERIAFNLKNTPQRKVNSLLRQATYIPSQPYQLYQADRIQKLASGSMWKYAFDWLKGGHIAFYSFFKEIAWGSKLTQLALIIFGALDIILSQELNSSRFDLLSAVLFNNKIAIYHASETVRSRPQLATQISQLSNSLAAHKLLVSHANFQLQRKESRLAYFKSKALDFNRESVFPQLLGGKQFETIVLQYSPTSYNPSEAARYLVIAAMVFRNVLATDGEKAFTQKLKLWEYMSSIDVCERIEEGLDALRGWVLGWQCVRLEFTDGEVDSRLVFQQCKSLAARIKEMLGRE